MQGGDIKEIALFFEAAEEGAYGEEDDFERARDTGNADAEDAAVERGPGAQAEAFHAIAVVAYKDERGAVGEALTVGFQDEAAEGHADHDATERDGEGDPSGDAVTAMYFALADQDGIKADAAVVYERDAVHGSDIHGAHMGRAEHATGRGEIRDAEIFGEVVEGAGGDDGEDGGAFGFPDGGGAGGDGAIAADCDEDIEAVAEGEDGFDFGVGGAVVDLPVEFGGDANYGVAEYSGTRPAVAEEGKSHGNTMLLVWPSKR